MKRTMVGLLILTAVFGVSASAQEGRGPNSPAVRQSVTDGASKGVAAIERAAAAKKFIFVFFWKEKNQPTDQAWSVLQPAAAKMTDWAEVAAVQVTDPAEQELVVRYDLSRTPLPLVLAIAPCGAITKGFTGKFTEEQLRCGLCESLYATVPEGAARQQTSSVVRGGPSGPKRSGGCATRCARFQG